MVYFSLSPLGPARPPRSMIALPYGGAETTCAVSNEIAKSERRQLLCSRIAIFDTPFPWTAGMPTRSSSTTKPAPTHSAADEAFNRLRALSSASRLRRVDDPTMTESDARAKLIGPLFREVLGWHESEIRREDSVGKGYVDYVLGSDYHYLLIEAKRSAPRFQFTVAGKPRRLKLDGPHLLKNRKIRDVIEQAQGYSADLGVQFCIATNGPQLVIFRSYVCSRSAVETGHRDCLS
jgi:hypothetical protein